MSTGRKVAWTLCTATPNKTFRALSNSCKEEGMAHHFMVLMHEDHTQKLREWKAKKKEGFLLLSHYQNGPIRKCMITLFPLLPLEILNQNIRVDFAIHYFTPPIWNILLIFSFLIWSISRKTTLWQPMATRKVTHPLLISNKQLLKHFLNYFKTYIYIYIYIYD